MAAEAVKVLIIDDVPIVVKALTNLLTNAGYAAEGVLCGEDGVTRARETAFDVSLIDMVMPGLDGIATSRAIRAVSPHTACILMTGYSELLSNERSRVFYSADGIMRVLEKPFSDSDVLSVIQNALNNRAS